MNARFVKISLLTALLIAISLPMAHAKVYMFDFGDEKSPVQQGYVQITPKTAFPAAEAGWAVAGKLEAKDKAYSDFTDSYRGKQPPPVWTTALSEDGIVSAEPAEFAAKVEPGKYHAWVLCGTSVSYRAQVFSFDVCSGKAVAPVQFENSYQYRDAYLDVDASGGEARLKFAPRSLFVVAGIVLWQDADAAKVKADIIKPERDTIDFMPPEQAAKWTLDPRVVDNSVWPQVSDADKQRGYLVHYRHWAEDVYPYTVPIAQEINPTLRAFATPGEYEPLNFIVYPFRTFAGSTLTVSDLKAGTTSTIPASAVELRRIRYMRARPNYTVLNQYRIVPDPLMPYDANEPLTEKENARFWLTVHVPANAKPGTYRGMVTFTPAGSTAANIPIVFRVLPIKLQEDPSKLYGIYYYDPLDSWSNAKDEFSKAFYKQKSDYELADLVAHGTRNVVTGLYGTPDKANPGKFTFNFDLLQMKVDRWRKAGLVGPVAVEVNAETIYTNLTKKPVGSHTGDVEAPPAEYATQLTEMCREIETERVKRGWPEFLYYPIDEPGTSPGAIAFMIETLKAVKAAGVKTYVTADPTNEGFAPLKPYIDVWCTQPFLPTRDVILRDEASRKVDYWCYPNHVNGENDHTTVNGARMTYGFGFWRSGFTALIPWIYRADIGNPWNYLDGTASDFFNRTEDSGRPIPVQMWEAYREGYDDYRYIYTLTKMIEQAKKQGGRAARAADNAQKDLDYCWSQIRVQPKYKWDDLWEPREGDVYRWVVAKAILDLQAAGLK